MNYQNLEKNRKRTPFVIRPIVQNGEMTWSISEFLKRPENKFFIEIEKDWITDRYVTLKFNGKNFRAVFSVFIFIIVNYKQFTFIKNLFYKLHLDLKSPGYTGHTKKRPFTVLSERYLTGSSTTDKNHTIRMICIQRVLLCIPTKAVCRHHF